MRKLVLLLLTLTYFNIVFALEFTDALMVLTPSGANKANSDFSSNIIIDDDTTNINAWSFSDFSIASDGKYYMASNEGISISSDSGVSWRNILPANGLASNDSTSIAAHDTDDENWVLVGSRNNGISASLDDGFTDFTTYNAANNGLVSDNVNSVAIDKNGTFYIATDNGLSIGWDVQNGLFFENYTTMEGLPHNVISEVLVKDTAQGTNIYLATNNGISFSTDGFNFSNSLAGHAATSIAVHKGVWYVGVVAGNGNEGGVYISIDQGATYTYRSVNPAVSVWHVEATDLAIYAGTTEGLAVSIDGGEIFDFYKETPDCRLLDPPCADQPEYTSLTDNNITGITALANTSVQLLATEHGLAISEYSGLIHSIYDSGVEGVSADSVHSVEYMGEENFLVTNGSGVSLSSDFGKTWQFKELGIELLGSAYNSNTGLIVVHTELSGIYISKDNGQSFEHITSANGLLTNAVSSVAISNGGIIYVSHEDDLDEGAGVSFSTDGGNSFTALLLYEADNILVSEDGSHLDILHVAVSESGSVFLATMYGLYVSSDGFATFTQYLADLSILTSTLVSDENWYLGGDDGLHVSHDGGNSFVTTNESEGLSLIQNIFVDENSAIYVESRRSLRVSIDDGFSFNSVYRSTASIFDSFIFSLTPLDTDADGFPDRVDTDDDNDGVLDVNDAFPVDAAETVDTDGDDTGNNADTDDDGDGVTDALDYYPLISLNGLTDTDNDGIPNSCDQACLDLGMAADVYPTGIIYVNDNSTCDALTDACGLTWGSAFPFLQDALAVATTNNNIWLAQGVYYPDDNAAHDNDGNSDATFFMVDQVGVYGGFSDDLLATQLSDADYENNVTVLSGDIDHNDIANEHGVVLNYTDMNGTNSKTLVQDTESTRAFTLQDLTINAASSNTVSGGIYLRYSGAILKNLTMVALEGGYGAAVYARHDLALNCDVFIMDNVVVKNNRAKLAGIIFINETPCSTIELNQLFMDGNSASRILRVSSLIPTTINGLSIVNSPTSTGLDFDGDALILKNALIDSTNKAIYFEIGDINLENVTLTNNNIALEIVGEAKVTAAHLTVVGNENMETLDVLKVQDTATLSLSHSIIAGNKMDGGENNIVLLDTAILLDGGYNIIGASAISGYYTFNGGQTFTQVFNSGSSFTATQSLAEIISTTLADNGGWNKSLMPVVNSQVINAIPIANCSLATDQRGYTRPYNATIPSPACDIGAVEVYDLDNDGIEDPLDSDDDGDGMDDDWENTYGLNSLSATDAGDDLDGDGVTNLQEYEAGSDPTDDQDSPNIPQVESTPNVNAVANVDYSYLLAASDRDNDLLSWRVTDGETLPAWLSLENSNVTTYANGLGDAAHQLYNPGSVVVDANGVIFIADTDNHRILKWLPNATEGITVAGGNGTGSEANQLNYPQGLAVDTNGVIYVADTLNHRVQKWLPNATEGVTVAGGNGSGSAANQLNSPEGIVVDENGVVYIADTYKHRIQKWLVNATEGVTVAGGNGRGSALNQLSYPRSVAVDSNGVVYVADGSNRIQKWLINATEGITVAGGNGRGAAANQLDYPYGVTVDTNGVIYVADTNNRRVQKWLVNATEGLTVAGGNGSGSAANQLRVPRSVAVDSNGVVYVADRSNHRIQKWLASASEGTTVAGGNGASIDSNQLSSPHGVVVDDNGTLYIADTYNHRIQKWLPNATEGITVAGGNGYGSASNQLYSPKGIAVDASGTIYIADTDNDRIQKWLPSATEGITIAGGNGSGSAANQLDDPTGIAIDTNGAIYITDEDNHRIQKWLPNTTEGITVAGGNGSGSASNQLSYPSGVAVDTSGIIYIADRDNHRIQKWLPNATEGVTVAGGNGGGSAPNQLNYQYGVAVDTNGVIYVADTRNYRVQKWLPNATEGMTVAGGNGQGFAANQLDEPYGVAVDTNGTVYIADRTNHRIQVVTNAKLTGTPTEQDIGIHDIKLLLSGGFNDVEHNFQISVNASPPTDIELSNVSITENNALTQTIGLLTTEDATTNDSHTYSLCGGADDGSFTIDSASLLVSEVFDYEIKDSYTICISSTDESNLNFEKTFTILIDLDTDGDGVADNGDAFPNDGSETLDTDGDSVGDNADAFPNDRNETLDSDGDGVGDNADEFPSDANEILDTDGDGIGDNSDADPLDPDVFDTTAPLVVVPENIVVAATDENGVSALNDAIALFLSLATASDYLDGILTGISHDAPAIFPLGDTQVTFSVSDNAGNIGNNTATVNVRDETPPTILLLGDESITINVGEEYSEQGATALDNVDGDVSNNIVITGKVDTLTLGLYNLQYNVTDVAGNIASTVTRNVSVQDSFAPVISVPLSIEVAATDSLGTARSNAEIAFFLNAASALDAMDGVIEQINHDAAVTLPLGVNTITFSATDLSGNTGLGLATIVVSDLTAPAINLLGLSAQTLNVGEAYNEMGVTVMDNVDGDISASIVVSGSVDSSKVGLYNLTYNIKDGAGNAAQTQVRVITVQDVAAPVVTAPAAIIVVATDANGTDAMVEAITEFLNGASATDDVDGFIGQVNNDAPLTFPLGVTTVVFSAQDSNGNIGFTQTSVMVTDQTAPVLFLEGEVNLLVNVGDEYVEQGASATDNVDGDLTASIMVTGSIETSIPGIYVKTYSVIDTVGNEANLSRMVSVQDVSAPVLMAPAQITVNSTDVRGVPISQAEIIDFLNSAVAQDDVDGEIFAIDNDAPQVFNLGRHIITFNATDSAGNTGFASSIITVVDTEAPVISLMGGGTISLQLYERYDEPGVSAFDSVDGDISSQIVITNNINTAILGSYEVHYSVVDSSGNTASISRKVVVYEVETAGIGPMHWYALMMLLMLMIRQRQYK